MTITRLLNPCAAILLLFGGAGASTAIHQPRPQSENLTTKKEVVPSITQQLKPLGDLLAQGEGNYDSVNRGYAGDTPGGMTGLTGRRLSSYTVAEVIQLQKGRLFAVGRYQFIPRTLRFAVDTSGVDPADLFDKSTQDRLMAALIAYKRPEILSYLQGSHDNLSLALDELAREWASVAYRNGRSYYSTAGNRAKITRAKASQVLQLVKDKWNDRGSLP